MNDEGLREQLQTIRGEDPSDRFVNQLRSRIDGDPATPTVEPAERSEATGEERPVAEDRQVTVVDLRDSTEGGNAWLRPSLLTAAAVALLAVVLVPLLRQDDGPPLGTAGVSQSQQVGDAWLRSIIEDDRAAFVALHADGVSVNDTVMGYSSENGVLTPERVSELYFDGFDALQASLIIDGDFLRSGGCDDVGDDQVRCSFTASLLGTEDYTYTMTADMTVEDRLITTIRFGTETEPEDLRSVVEPFFAELANDEDVACMALGFNTEGCGRHDSDFMSRYVAFYEQQQDQEG